MIDARKEVSVERLPYANNEMARKNGSDFAVEARKNLYINH